MRPPPTRLTDRSLFYAVSGSSRRLPRCPLDNTGGGFGVSRSMCKHCHPSCCLQHDRLHALRSNMASTRTSSVRKYDDSELPRSSLAKHRSAQGKSRAAIHDLTTKSCHSATGPDLVARWAQAEGPALVGKLVGRLRLGKAEPAIASSPQIGRFAERQFLCVGGQYFS